MLLGSAKRKKKRGKWAKGIGSVVVVWNIWLGAWESPTEKVTFDLKEVKRRIISSRENSKCKGPVEEAR